MEERWTAARAAGLPSGRRSLAPCDDPPKRRGPIARIADAARLSSPAPRAGDQPDALVDRWSRPGDETVAFRPLRVTAEDSVRYLAEVGVSAIPHTHPHVRLGRAAACGLFLVPDVVARPSLCSSTRPSRPGALRQGRYRRAERHRAAARLSLSKLDLQTYELIMLFTVRTGVANNARRASGRAAPPRRGSRPSLERAVAGGATQGRGNEGGAAMRGFQSEQPVRADGGRGL